MFPTAIESCWCKGLSNLSKVHLIQWAEFRSFVFCVVLFMAKNNKKQKCKLLHILPPFRALLYGGMKESQPQAEVCLEETRAEAFSMLLNYLYTGRASLSSAREEVLLDFLGLAHRYGLQPLEDSTSDFLRTILHTNNVCLVFDVASLYSLSALTAACCTYMDRHAPEVLNSEGFLTLSKVRVMEEEL